MSAGSRTAHSALQDAAVGFQDLAAFVELHIEQGADLEERGLSLRGGDCYCRLR